MIEQELEFREYLTSRESRKLRDEEEALDKARRDLFIKYNEIISDHMSRNVLLDELKKRLEYWSTELSELFYSLDNKTLQIILSALVMAEKEKQRVKKEREDRKKEIDKATREAGWLVKEDTE